MAGLCCTQSGFLCPDDWGYVELEKCGALNINEFCSRFMGEIMEFGNTILLTHLAATIIGIAAAFYLELIRAKLCNSGNVTRRIYLGFRRAVKICIFATALLWSTSLVYISYHANVAGMLIGDPIFWARITITVVISYNLLLVTHVALPMVKNLVGISIFGGLTESQQNKMIAMASVSGISWITITVLGFVKLNTAGQDTLLVYGFIVLVYAIALCAGLLLSKVGGFMLRKRFLQRMEEKRTNHRRLVGHFR